MRPSDNALNTLSSASIFDQRLGLALLASAVLHGALLFGVNFKLPDWKQSKDFGSALEVVLVNSKSASRPVKADALAQANLDGGGNTDADRRAKSPMPVLKQEQTEAEIARKTQQVQHLEQQARALMTQVKARQSVETSPTSAPHAVKAEPVPDAADLIQKSLEAVRLEAQIARDWDSYQKRPKRKFVGARTQDYRYARYVEDWRIKVERVGNLNYPEAAKQQKLYGSLRLTVSIRADGSVDSVEINESSGHKLLDAAAVHIVQLAAPYAPFPEDIRKDTDILSITRTWTFTRSDQLLSQ